MRRTVGILGGMGPAATADLFNKVISATPAERDQDHLRVLVDCNPLIPDRAAAIDGRGPDPIPGLRGTARNLEEAGADLLIMACNTAHYFYSDVRSAVGIPMLHIMEETAAHIKNQLRGVERVGILATDTTVKYELYHRPLERWGLTPVAPEPKFQRLVMRSIYEPDGVKAGNFRSPRRWVRRAAENVIEQGAQAVILGCTELPLVMGPRELPVPTVDPTWILARAAVREAFRDDRRVQV